MKILVRMTLLIMVPFLSLVIFSVWAQEFAQADGPVIAVTASSPDIAADGKCSLIEAIINANDDAATHADCPAGDGADTIVLLAKTTYRLTAVQETARGSNGLPVISSTITISGQQSIIERDLTAPDFRLFYVASTGKLTLHDLTLRNGRAAGEADSARFGGAIFIRGAAYLNQITVTDNAATASGGGILNLGKMQFNRGRVSNNTASFAGGGIYNVAEGTITDSLIQNNTAENGGGGIVNLDATLTVNRTILRGNRASGDSTSIGGGLVNQAFEADATTILNQSQVISNVNELGIGGGGLANFSGNDHTATLNLNYTTVSDNRTTGRNFLFGTGGGIRNGIVLDAEGLSIITLNNSTVQNNTAVNGGGISNAIAGEVDGRLQVKLYNSTVSSNTATIAATNPMTTSMTGNGGGIVNQNGAVTLVNSTISGNTANGDPRTLGGLGGGIVNAGSTVPTTVRMTNTTIANNSALAGSGVTNLTLSPQGSAIIHFKNSLIAANTNLAVPGNCFTPATPPNPVGLLVSQGHNVSDDGRCNFVQATDLPSSTLNLGPLQDNEGFNRTHALLPGSSAINSGEPTACTTTDQRGFGRSGNCDSGAYEANGTDAQGPVFPAVKLAPSGGITLTIPRPRFDWDDALDNVGVAFYTLVLTSENDLSGLDTATITTTLSTYTPTIDLPNGGYSWAVTAHDTAGNGSPTTEAARFTLQLGRQSVVYLPLVNK